METSIVISPTTNTQVSGRLLGIEADLRHIAEENLRLVLAEEDSYTELEKRAMVVIETLRQVNGVDLAALLLRAKLIRQIREEALWTVHPGGQGGHFTTLEAMAKEQGISATELSGTIALVETIFPYIEQALDRRVAILWEQIGKSKFFELVPVLKAIISNTLPETGSTRVSVERILEDVRATALAAGQTPTEDEVRQTAVEMLLEDGSNLPTMELRRRIRPDHTPPITSTAIKANGRRYVISEMDDDQFLMWQRLMSHHSETFLIDLPSENNIRAQEARRVPAIKHIADLLAE